MPEPISLSDHFTTIEFQCPDNCGFGSHREDISEELIEVLESMRSQIGPLKINSGCRCKLHNASIGGAPDSAHLYGLAVDIDCPDSHVAYLLVSEAFLNGIVRVGLERGCIHIDVSERPEHLQKVLFTWDRQEHVR